MGPTYENLNPAERIGLVHRIILTCHNLKEVKLVLGNSDVGGEGFYPHPGLDFEAHNGTLSPFKHLELQNYPISAKPDGTPWMEWEAKFPSPKVLITLWNRLPASFVHYIGYKRIQALGGVHENYVKMEKLALKKGILTNLDFGSKEWTGRSYRALRSTNQKPTSWRNSAGTCYLV